MSIISRIFLKIRVALFGGPDHDIVFYTDDEYDIPHTPNKDVQSYLDCPSKPAGITPVSYTHLTLPTIALLCRSRGSPYH